MNTASKAAENKNFYVDISLIHNIPQTSFHINSNFIFSYNNNNENYDDNDNDNDNNNNR